MRLNPMPDGFGFIYGDAVDANGETRRINIMPPISSWRGDMKLGEHGPHPTDWVLYVDGDQVARATSHGEIIAALDSFLREANA